MLQITTRLELNALDKMVNPVRVGAFVFKHSCPAIVTVPSLVAPFIADRVSKRGKYKIIAVIDYPDGKNFAMQKLRDLSEDALAADGFDIMYSNGHTGKEIDNEVRLISEFLKSVNPVAEIRWIVGSYGRGISEQHIDAIVKYPCNWVRLDPYTLKNGVGLEDHKKAIAVVRNKIVTPIKISCNVTYETIEAFKSDRNMRFDVNLNQASNIIRFYNEQETQKTQEPAKEKAVDTLGPDVK
jgi:hypothetical protein